MTGLAPCPSPWLAKGLCSHRILSWLDGKHRSEKPEICLYLPLKLGPFLPLSLKCSVGGIPWMKGTILEMRHPNRMGTRDFSLEMHFPLKSVERKTPNELMQAWMKMSLSWIWKLRKANKIARYTRSLMKNIHSLDTKDLYNVLALCACILCVLCTIK